MATAIRTDRNIPVIYLAQAINTFKNKMVLSNLVNRDFSSQIASKGETIKIQDIGSATAKFKTEGVDVIPDAISDTDIDIVIDKHMYVAWSDEDLATSVSFNNAMAYLVKGIEVGVEQMEKDLIGLYTQAPNSVGAAANPLDYPTFLQAMRYMDQRNFGNERYMVVGPNQKVDLLQEDKFIHGDYINEKVVPSARVGRLAGFNVLNSNLLPTGIPHDEALAFIPSAMTLVTRTLRTSDDAGANQTTLTDPETGLTFRYSKGRNHLSMKTDHIIDIVYGVKLMKDDRLLRIESLTQP